MRNAVFLASLKKHAGGGQLIRFEVPEAESHATGSGRQSSLFSSRSFLDIGGVYCEPQKNSKSRFRFVCHGHSVDVIRKAQPDHCNAIQRRGMEVRIRRGGLGRLRKSCHNDGTEITNECEILMMTALFDRLRQRVPRTVASLISFQRRRSRAATPGEPAA